MRLAVTPSWHAGQVCSGGAAGLGPPDASGAGAILSSQHSGHSTCGRPCQALPVLPHEVRRAGNEQQVEAPAKGKPRRSRHAAVHRGSPVPR